MPALRVAILIGVALASIPAQPAAAQPPVAPGSLSCGAANRGALAGAQALPDSGDGFVTPEPWRARGLRFGTDELLGVIGRAAAQVARHHGGGTLAVADLSAERGGAVPHHASHQSGRDADLIYYAIDRAGDPFAPDHHMAFYGPDGRAVSAESPAPAGRIDERFFDMQRNWALVAALVSDPEVDVTRIFVSSRVRSWLLAYGRATAAPPELLARVQDTLYTARDASTHQDHLHVRIACSQDDIDHGRCSDEPAPPPRARRRRGKRRKKVQPRRWYAQVQCVDPRLMAASEAPDASPAGDGLATRSSAEAADSSAGESNKSSKPNGKAGSLRSARGRTVKRPDQKPSRRSRARHRR